MHTCASQLWRDIEVVITGLTRNFVVILELSASHPLIYKGFPQFKYNLIRKRIEVVITGLTRNFVVILELSASNPLIYKGFPQFKYNLIR